MLKKEICNCIFEVTIQPNDIAFRSECHHAAYIDEIGLVISDKEIEIPQIKIGDVIYLYRFISENKEIYMWCEKEIIGSEYIAQKSEIEKEVNALVNFFKPFGFTKSSEVSNYIRKHKLGYQFPTISGYLELTDGCNNWEFEGGIAPQYYAEVCRRLGLKDNDSDSRVVGYESYEDRQFKK